MTVRYDQDRYTVSEETGYVTLALVLEGDAPIPVTVSVNTLNLLDSNVGDAATGELLKSATSRNYHLLFFFKTLIFQSWSIIHL